MLDGVSYLRTVILKDGTHLRWRVANISADDDSGLDSVSGYRVYLSHNGTDYIKLGEVSNTVNDQLLSALPYSSLSSSSFLKVSAVAPDGTEYFPSNQHLPHSPAVFWSLDYLPGNKTVKYPPWFNQLSDSEQSSLRSQVWFSDWLSTTTSLWPDVTKVKEDNPGVPYDVIWRSDDGVLFHADEEGRRPDEVFVAGLTPPESMGSMKLRPGKHVGVLESFSRLFDGTSPFADCDSMALSRSDYDERYIYLTNAPGGICVDETLHTPAAMSESEIAFPGGIKGKYITGAFVFKISPDRDKYLPVRFDYNAASDFKKPEAGFVNVITARSDDNAFYLLRQDGSEWITAEAPVSVQARGKYKVKSKNKYRKYYVNLQQVTPGSDGSFELDTDTMSVDGVLIVSGHNYRIAK
ncbi:hypothetical protein E1A04_23690 [Salmonella enterica subsp. enterica serovar Virchow]|nr:hypothetical protein [Salmonella enterica subsp. enterica serovar Virchow]ECD4427622.1 hypothetical protein [Salmonella enterica subsp. enterica serovar Virchow]